MSPNTISLHRSWRGLSVGFKDTLGCERDSRRPCLGFPFSVLQPSVVSARSVKLVSCSRYALRTVPWPNAEPEAQVEYLLELAAQHKLDRWMLFPTSDESAALLSKFHTVLSRRFYVTAPTWDILRWAYDKRLTYRLAAEQQVDYPSTIYPPTQAAPTPPPPPLPPILNPAPTPTS